MKRYAIALLCVTAPLAAQQWEAGLFLGQQSYRDQEVPDAGNVQANSKTVYGVRLGYSVVDLGPALLQVTAAYQPKNKTHAKGDDGTLEDFQYTHQYFGVGAMFNFKALVAVGAGLEYRFEKVGVESQELGNHSASYGRPWLRANVGYAIPSPVVKPFVGLEVAVPLTRKSLTVDQADFVTNVDDALRSLAPKYQVGAYFGVRF